MRQNSSSSLSMGYDGSTSTLDGLGRRVAGGGGVGGPNYNALPIPTAAAFGGGGAGPNPVATRSFNNSAIFVKMASNGGDRHGGGLVANNGAGQLIGGVPPPLHQEYSLSVICSALINQDQLWRLFDIIPGLDYCQIMGESGPNANRAVVKYNNLESCTYAKDKLHGLEYPLGERLIVKMDVVATATTNPSTQQPGAMVPPTVGNSDTSSPTGRSALVGDLPLQAQMDGWDNNNLCSVTLPPPAQLAYTGTVCAQRCFLVCVSQVMTIIIFD